MQLLRPTSDREFITKSGTVLAMVEFVGLPFEQRSPAARVPQFLLIGAATIPSCFRVAEPERREDSNEER